MMEGTLQNNNSNNPVAQTPVNPAPVNAPVNQTPVPQTNQSLVDEEHPEDLDVTWTRLKCLVCNYTYEGMKRIDKCPRCGNEDPDKFSHAD